MKRAIVLVFLALLLFGCTQQPAAIPAQNTQTQPTATTPQPVTPTAIETTPPSPPVGANQEANVSAGTLAITKEGVDVSGQISEVPDVVGPNPDTGAVNDPDVSVDKIV